MRNSSRAPKPCDMGRRVSATMIRGHALQAVSTFDQLSVHGVIGASISPRLAEWRWFVVPAAVQALTHRLAFCPSLQVFACIRCCFARFRHVSCGTCTIWGTWPKRNLLWPMADVVAKGGI
eukprot:7003831-Prymnesium_polylepis.1